MDLLARARTILVASTALAAALLLAPPATRGQDAQSPAASGEFDLALIDHGGRIEGDLGAQAGKAWHLIAGTADEYYWSSSEDLPQEVVLSFLGRQSALISSIVLSQSASGAVDAYAKDVEVWISPTSPDQGFVKLGAAVMPREPGAEQRLEVAPVEARFVKLRITSNHSPDAASGYTELGRIKVIEGSRTGYQSLLQRNPDLAALLSGAAPAQLSPPAPAAPTAEPAPPAASEGCEPLPPPAKAPPRPGTRHLLVVSEERNDTYPPLDYRKDPADPQSGFYKQLEVLALPSASFARPAMLAAGGQIDTVVLSQLCDIQTSVSDAFKKALIAWVAEGHKLIIHDADNCSGDASPDYGFLPYKFATSNPGARGAHGDNLVFVEENAMANGDEKEPGFLDLPRWREDANELGDSNTITAYDAHWCGHLFGTNVLAVNGFIEAYAHHGRGLIVYDGFDVDQAEQPDYRRLVTRELMQPVDPDGLLCSAKLGDFVIATDEHLKSQPMIPGRSYRYPLTLLSNQGYQGKVALSITPVPADPGVSWTFDADSIDLTAISKTNLLVSTTPQASRGAHALGVRGIDAAGKSALLCLRLPERTSGGLRVTSAALSAKPQKNLEIILDLSGSMKLPLGKSTRIATARQVLRGVLQKIPDDFNVGLRFYGNRYGSRQKETCTDTELVAPIAPIDRDALQSLVDAATPRGETPLVYSVLQTPADLKEVGGGSVVLITDGEESCKGDPAKAAQQLRASGIDVTLNIVGFTLTGKEVQQQLTTLAEATGGHFYRADNAETLSRALLNAAIDRIPFSVFAADGSKVAEGETNGDAIELAAGTYKVVARAGDQELVAEHVAITAAGDVALQIMLEDGRFRIGGAP